MKNKRLLLTMMLALACFVGGKVMAQTSVYETDFESMNTYIAPTNWTNMGGIIQVQTNGAINGSKSTRFGGNTNTSIVAMPSISNINTLQITFSHKSSANDAGTFEIGYVTSTSDASTFNTISSYSASDYTTASTVTVSLSTASSGAYIAFRHTTATTYKYWYIDDITVELPSASCSTPTDLSAVATSSTTANISWTAGNTETAWQLYYSNVGYATPYNASEGDFITINTTPSYTLTGLTPNTEHFVYVRAKCGEDDFSDWTDVVSFTTFNPQSLPVINDFEDGEDDIDDWTMRDTHANTGVFDSDTYGESSYCFRFYSSFQGITQYLITPELSGTSNGVYVQFYRKQTAAGAWIQVGYSTETISTEDFIWSEATPNSATNKNNYVSYELYCPANTKFVAIKNTAITGTHIFIDNISITVPPTANTNGNWNNAATWANGVVPSSSANVVISSDVTIPDGYTATANDITIDGGSLTIADGGQLICNNAVEATVKKSITAASNWGDGDYTPNNWYFIASPVNTLTSVTGMHTTGEAGDYDLYRLDNTTWKNYKQEGFSLVNGRGYLYASENGTTIEFAGTTKPYSEVNNANKVPVNAGWNLVGNPYTFNTFVNQNYYTLNSGRTAVTAVTGNAAIAPCTGILVNAENVGYVTFSDEVTSDEATLSLSKGNIELALAQATRGGITLDNAIVSFGEGNELKKFYFGEQNANIYIPQGAEEYAIVSSNGQGEMPVNFRANEDGQYTLTVSTEGVEMNYLHLIDNMTGADVDLLATPSYTFNAKTTDYESRFKLVFAANSVSEAADGDNDAPFAFVSNGEIILVGVGADTCDTDTCDVSLQVIDMQGRVLIRRDAPRASAISTNGMAPGVYVMRLISGEKVRTQKIVVR